MDEQRFHNARRLRDERKFVEAYNEFIQIAEGTPDPLHKAGVLLHAAHTLEISGQYEAATSQLSTLRTLIEDHARTKSVRDERLPPLEFFLDFEEANLLWLRGDDPEATLNRFEAALKKHRAVLKDPLSGDLYEATQIRRAFILADLGRCKEALPILEEIKSPQEYREGVAFYLGHCYLAADEYEKAEEKLTQALKLGLPGHLEYRAHCALGMVYYNLRDYSKAKQELEKGAEKADADYIKQSHIWKWLEFTCRLLGLKADADHYARLANPS